MPARALLELDQYEAANLEAALRTLRELKLDTGDWMQQVIDRLPAYSVRPNRSVAEQLTLAIQLLRAEARRAGDKLAHGRGGAPRRSNPGERTIEKARIAPGLLVSLAGL